MTTEQVFLTGVILVMIILVLFILLFICLRQLNKTRAEMRNLVNIRNKKANKQNSLPAFETAGDVSEKLNDLQRQLDVLNEKQKKCFDCVEIVRYIADGEQNVRSSYSVGLTNEDRDGLVITGLMYRNGMNLYVKKIDEGVCEYTLSEEEKEAIGRNKVAEVRS